MLGFFQAVGAFGELEYFEVIKDIDLNKLEIFGKSYIFDCLRVQMTHKHHNKLYQMYVTDAIRAAVYNTSHEDTSISIEKHFSELLAPPTKEETRTSDEIITDLKQKFRNLK